MSNPVEIAKTVHAHLGMFGDAPELAQLRTPRDRVVVSMTKLRSQWSSAEIRQAFEVLRELCKYRDRYLRLREAGLNLDRGMEENDVQMKTDGLGTTMVVGAAIEKLLDALEEDDDV
jgi:hypothetical protein